MEPGRWPANTSLDTIPGICCKALRDADIPQHFCFGLDVDLMVKVGLPPLTAGQVCGNSIDCVNPGAKGRVEQWLLQDVLRSLRPSDDTHADLCTWAYRDLCNQWNRGIMAMINICMDDVRELARCTIAAFFKEHEQAARQPQLSRKVA